MAAIAEILLDDNQSLRKLLITRDEETHRLLQQISESTEQSYEAIRQENKFLKQEIENFIAITAQLKEVNKHLEANCKNKEAETAKASDLLRSVNRELETEKFKVRYLTEQKEGMEPRFLEGRQKLVELEKDNVVLKQNVETIKVRLEDALAKVRTLTAEKDKLIVEKQENELLNFEKLSQLEKQVRELKEKLSSAESRHTKERSATPKPVCENSTQMMPAVVTVERLASRETPLKQTPDKRPKDDKLMIPSLPMVGIQDISGTVPNQKQQDPKLLYYPGPNDAPPVFGQVNSHSPMQPSVYELGTAQSLSKPSQPFVNHQVSYKVIRK